MIADFRAPQSSALQSDCRNHRDRSAIGAALYVINPGAPVVLVANLNPADRTALALRLRRHDIKFTLGADSITVGSRDVSQARALLQSSPGFSGGSEDFRCSIARPWGRATSMSR